MKAAFEEVKSDVECQICFTNRRDALILPCCHMLYCRSCVDRDGLRTPRLGDSRIGARAAEGASAGCSSASCPRVSERGREDTRVRG